MPNFALPGPFPWKERVNTKINDKKLLEYYYVILYE
jgi:hypothetical protein